MDKEWIRKSFARGLNSYHQNAKAQDLICQVLVKMIEKYSIQKPSNTLEIGCGSGFLSQNLMDIYPNSNFIFNDLVSEAEFLIRKLANDRQLNKIQFIAGDAENIAFPSNIDLLCSASTLQWFENLDAFAQKVHLSLNDHGIFAFSSFGIQNFKEIKQITNQSINYLAFDKIEKIIGNYFEVLEKQEDEIVLYFDHPIEVLKHIRLTGVKGHLGQKWTKGELAQFVSNYQSQFTVEQQVSLTYHPLYFVCKK